MLINTDKKKLMLISSLQKRNNTDLKTSINEKILGVYVDKNFVWNNHFLHVSKNISSHL